MTLVMARLVALRSQFAKSKIQPGLTSNNVVTFPFLRPATHSIFIQPLLLRITDP
jgi:hypothetical protein